MNVFEYANYNLELMFVWYMRFFGAVEFWTALYIKKNNQESTEEI